MKVWIDILTPKQSLFFKPLIKELRNHQHDVIVTSRDYKELNELLELHKIDSKVIGEHGGAELKQKLIASTKRILKLTEFISAENPTVAISFSSVEATRVSFGLKIPHICISDSPHSVAVSKLTIPLSSFLFTPFVIPKKIWIQYGISGDKIIKYKAIDAFVWLKDFKPDKQILEKLELPKEKKIITVRTYESFASYLLGRTNIVSDFLVELVENIAIKFSSTQIVIIPRYLEQINYLKNKIKCKNVKILEKAIDAQSLLYFSDLFIGAGGTMSLEAALMGIPVISIFPSNPTMIEAYLIKKKLIYRCFDKDKIIQYTQKIMRNNKYRELQNKRAKKLLKSFSDPIREIVDFLERQF